MEGNEEEKLTESDLSKIRVCARMRPPFYDETKAQISMSFSFGCIEIKDTSKPAAVNSTPDAKNGTERFNSTPSTTSENSGNFGIKRKQTSIGVSKRYYLDEVFAETVSNRQVYTKF